ncbi:MAG: glycosyltransferase family 2 protein [Kiritimatiellia bacterium]
MKEAIVIVPAYNEELNIRNLLEEIRAAVPAMDVVVLNDGSLDRTAQIARECGAKVLDLPCNLGVGGAVQAGFGYAYEQGYQYAVRIDGDGQHPPSEIPKLLESIRASEADLIIGSRFLGERSYRSTRLRFCGIYLLAQFLSLICRRRVTDPTSGFQALKRPLLYFFSQSYPMDYPEPEALALMRRQGYDFAEVPAIFRERQAGVSSIQGWGTLYYLLKVFLALIVDRARSVDPRLSRNRVMEAM